MKTKLFIAAAVTNFALIANKILAAFTIRAEADNLFDEEYHLNSFAPIWFQPGTPQNFRLSTSLKF